LLPGKYFGQEATAKTVIYFSLQLLKLSNQSSFKIIFSFAMAFIR